MASRLTRARFVGSAAAALAAIAGGVPVVGRAQFVVSDPLLEQLAAQQVYQSTQHTLQTAVTNKVALANDLNTLRLAQGLIFDHENFITAAWPLITANLNSMTQAWGNVSLINLAGKDLIAALTAQYPGWIDKSGALQSVMGRLAVTGISQIGQWLTVLQADHTLAQQELQRNSTNVTSAQTAQSMNDILKAQVNVASAATNIAGAQETDLQALNGQMAAVLQSINVQAAAKQQSSSSSSAMVFGSGGGMQYHTAPGASTAPLVPDSTVLSAANTALNVPILQAPPASVIQR